MRLVVGRIRAVIESPDPPWEGGKKLIWSGGKNLVSPKSRPSEFVGRKKSSLAGDIATLHCRIASRYPPTSCVLLKSILHQMYCSVHAVFVKLKIFIYMCVCTAFCVSILCLCSAFQP